MNPTPTRIPAESGYAKLPECIRQHYTEREYLWLTAQQKRDIAKLELEPEYDE